MILVLSICRKGKYSSKSPRETRPSSRSACAPFGPMPSSDSSETDGVERRWAAFTASYCTCRSRTSGATPLHFDGMSELRRFTFPSTHRLSGKLAFARVYENGSRDRRGPLIAVVLPNGLSHLRLGLSVSRSVGTAPRRLAGNYPSRHDEAVPR